MSKTEQHGMAGFWEELKRRRVPGGIHKTGATAADEPEPPAEEQRQAREMGEIEHALDLLEEAIDNGFGYRAWLEHDNSLDNLREQPRFQALLKRLD